MPVHQRRRAEHVHARGAAGFRYTSGEPRKFSRSDLESPVTREFCGECGTHLTTRRPGLPLIILKVATLDNPSLFGAPQMAIYTVDKQPFHIVPEGVQTFERLPSALTEGDRIARCICTGLAASATD
jgi:hypothetical protein